MSQNENWTTETLCAALARSEPASSGDFVVELVESADPGILITMTEFGDLPLLMSVIAERTGYGVEELEVDFELEADLGIDTVKQAEILAELQSRPETRFKVVSNLPYSISTLIIPILLQGPIPVERMVLTVQKEVGERLVAVPGTKDYGSLSVIIQTWANVEILKILPNTVFWPQPKVDSAIVGITPRFDRLERIDDTDLFRTIAQGLFSARRKKAVNALKQDERVMVPAETLKRGFEIAAIDPDRRGEDLSVDEVISLANAIEEARQTIEAPTG